MHFYSFLIGIIFGFIAVLVIELFFIWLLVFREDKRDGMKTDYDEIDDY